jgi:hemoglobin
MLGNMKHDINNREDIDVLMWDFYSKALSDDVIGYIFTDIAKLDLDEHIPIIGDFWETVLFQSGDYGKHGRNPLQVHARLHQMSPLLFEHFERWLEIFNESVDQHFAGERADFIKIRANAIGNRFMHYLGSVPAYAR